MGQPYQFTVPSIARSDAYERSPRRSGTCGGPCIFSVLRRFRFSRLRVPHLFLSPNELAIVWRIEVEKRATRRKVLNERLADCIGGACRKHRHYKSGCQCSEDRYGLQGAGCANTAACRNKRSAEARD